MNQIIALIKKDLLIDFRQKYVVASIALYVFAIIYVAYLSFNNVITPATWNALFWLILLFSSVTGLGKSFSQESHRSHYYYFLAKPVYILTVFVEFPKQKTCRIILGSPQKVISRIEICKI